MKIMDVNKTVKVIATNFQMGTIIDLGQMLSILPTNGNNEFTRPYIQDACYCAYGWDVAQTNEVINQAVEMGLFDLI